jgi:hypothetical protein
MLSDPAHALPEEPWFDRPLTALGRALDTAALRGMCLLFDSTLALNPDEHARVRASIAPYVTPELQRDPRRFFAFLDAPNPPRLLASVRRRRLADGDVIARRFVSGYRWFDATCNDDAVDCKENALIHVEHWRHDARPAATVVALHGFTMGNPRLDAFILMAAQWYRRGLDVVLMTLPFHGARSPRTARYSGEFFGSWHAGRLNESVRQAVHDVDLVMRWAESERGVPVGIAGLSLGGYISAVVAALRSTPAFVIPIVPPISLATLPSQLFALSRHQRGGVPPLSHAELEAAYRVHSPLSYPLAVPKERVLIIAGRGDCIVPPDQPHALWRHWGKPAIHWYSGSHVVPFRRPEILAAALKHLETLGLLSDREHRIRDGSIPQLHLVD